MKSRFSAAILAFALGTFGINNFYTKNTTHGIIDILVSVFGSVFFCIPTLVITVLNVVRGCQYLWCDTDEQFVQKYVKVN